MTSKLYLLLGAALFTGACVASDADEVGEDLAGDTGEANGPIFPDDELPQYSCALGVPLTCPSTLNFTVSAPQSFVNDARLDHAVSQTAVAAISADGSTIQCQPSSAFTYGGVPGRGIFLPNGISAVKNAFNNAFAFRDSRGNSVGVPVTLQAPVPSAPPGAVSCAMHCDMEGAVATVCRNQPNPAADNATITLGGRSTSVDMLGTIETLGTRNGRTDYTCAFNIPADRIATQVNTRPRDIIAVNRNRFVRGFELRGTALTDACKALATRTCNGSPSCTSSRTAACVAEFSGSDPCGSSTPR